MAVLVNGERISAVSWRAEAKRLRPYFNGKDEETFRAWVRESVIEHTLLRQEAWRDGDSPPQEEITAAAGSLPRELAGGRYHEAEARLRVDRLLRQITARLAAPKPKEISEVYRQQKTRLWVAERVQASHMVKNVELVHEEQTAQEILARARTEVLDGRPFDEAAEAYSDCRGNGGALGWFPRGQMVPEFDTVVFALPCGQLSEVFRTPFGFHLALVHERRPAGVPPFEELRDQIAAQLVAEKRQRAIHQFLQQVRRRSDIREVPE